VKTIIVSTSSQHHYHHYIFIIIIMTILPSLPSPLCAVKSSGDKSAGKIKMQKDPIFLQVVEEVAR
jgi:membrane protein YqaA with SNARE-associated domain